MLIKNVRADTIDTSNPVLADCPPMKRVEIMLSSLTKLQPSIAVYHVMTNYRAAETALLIKRRF